MTDTFFKKKRLGKRQVYNVTQKIRRKIDDRVKTLLKTKVIFF